MKSLTSQIIALLLQEMQDEISKTPQPVIVDVNISKMSISTITTQSTSLKKNRKKKQILLLFLFLIILLAPVVLKVELVHRYLDFIMMCLGPCPSRDRYVIDN